MHIYGLYTPSLFLSVGADQQTSQINLALVCYTLTLQDENESFT